MNTLTLPEGYAISAMSRAEAEVLLGWAAVEGWNPGLADLEVAWSFDPQGFIALRHTAPGQAAELVGGGAILSYGGECGFMGLFIMRADQRGQGLGRVLWHERLRRLQARLAAGAYIGMDGVLNMAPFYAAGGFVHHYYDYRFQGAANPAALTVPAGVATVPLASVPFGEVEAYDREVFGRPLRRWLAVNGGHGLAVLGEGGGLRGYAFLRPCLKGHKFGPVFADDAATARALLRDLLAQVPGETVALDVPEPNVEAMAIAQELGWERPFACAKMFHGASPPDTTAQVYGVTSFEFG
jgi:Acetyltransferase (GNAT) domain